jgi:hydroxymethylpyrimidine pyrophosphatase-like HAD family hydrolase
MKPIAELPPKDRRRIGFVLTDIDDTLTVNGRLPAVVFAAMERLLEAGIHTIPVTGRPAGWCDHIARMWPVTGVVGENGAFYFCYDVDRRRMIRRYQRSDRQRRLDRLRLNRLQEQILRQVPGAAVSADQGYREADLAIDCCEDVSPLPDSDVQRIVDLFESVGATAKISSIHVNGWFGAYDKLSMTRQLFREKFAGELADMRNRIIFIGDSANDAPLFGYFPNSVGVANVRLFVDKMEHLPTWITTAEGGFGFVELVDRLLR